MKVTVYVVVTYHGGYGDDVLAFGTRKEAEAHVIKYAKEYWDTKEFGRFPRAYDALYEAWDDHDLWGSTDCRWELEEREVEVPDSKLPPPPERMRKEINSGGSRESEGLRSCDVSPVGRRASRIRI
jgi:hypothetical protein